MSEIKSWAFSLCLILIVTGVFMRLLPERSDKKTVKFVVTLILIVCLFKLDISSVGDMFKADFSVENGEAVSEYESELKEKISGSVNSETEEQIVEIYKEYDENAEIELITDGGKPTVIITGTRLSGIEKYTAQSRIETQLGEAAEFIYRER